MNPGGHERSDDRKRTRPLFVIGTGRSGTHWLGHILDGHPDVRGRFETWPIFHWVTRMALDPRMANVLYPLVASYYRLATWTTREPYFLDKSHPNLWHVERLARTFPEAKFVGIQRDAEPTVSSMVVHKGVLKWQERFRRYPIPNRFLGITEELRHDYGSLSVATQCALRWKAHRDELARLAEAMPDRVLVLAYEDLITHPAANLNRLEAFLRLMSPLPQPTLKTESLEKWRTVLSDDQLSDIQAVVQAGSPG